RLTAIIYPNGRGVTYTYTGGYDGVLNDKADRVENVSVDGAIVEWYSYLGQDTVVVRHRNVVGTDLTYIQQAGDPTGDAGDKYFGLDRFGRVVDQRWIYYSNGTLKDGFQYGYDADGNVLYRVNLLNSTFDELYHANGSGNGYDGLNRLTNFARGTLNGTNDTIVSPTHSQSFTLDAEGNFGSVTTDGTTQNRTANQQNEITSISGLTTPQFDSNGNMTTDERGQKLIYDAWNRLVQVKNSGGTVLETYGYDAEGRRITENTGTVRHLYYDMNGDVIEERVGTSTSATIQYVWSPNGPDMLILRDRDTTGGGTLNERLYFMQDANGDVTAVQSNSGTVVERYVYDPYGVVTVLDANWNVRSSSSYAMNYLFQGQRYDGSIGYYDQGARVYSPTLGRPAQQDPIGYAGGGTNFYQWEGDGPVNSTDPMGLGDPAPWWRDRLQQGGPIKPLAPAATYLGAWVVANGGKIAITGGAVTFIIASPVLAAWATDAFIDEGSWEGW